ncbi:hypothetical protein [Streptomyces sp. NPDC000880]
MAPAIAANQEDCGADLVVLAGDLRSRQDHLNRRAEEELDRFRAAPAATAEGLPALVDAAREDRIASCSYGPKGRTRTTKSGWAASPSSWRYAVRTSSTWANRNPRRRARTTRCSAARR